MAVPIAEMERFAMGGDSLRMDSGDIGNVIELGDMGMGDDFGLMNGLANTTFNRAPQEGRTVNMAPSMPSSAPQRSSGGSGISFGSSSGGLGGLETIDVTPLEPLEPIRLAPMEPETINMNDFGGGGGPSISISREGGGFGGPGPSLFDNSQSATGPGIQLSSAHDPGAEKKEKGDYLNKLQRLEQKGFPVSRKFTMDNSLEEIKTEYFRLVDARNLEISIKFQRQMLMGAVTGIEWLNGRFDPFDLKLDGWSESVHETVEDFDEIFEELYDKYKDKGKMSPEVQLIMKLAGSGFMCHISNSFFRRNMPSMDDVLRRNPELARQMAAAAAGAAAPGFGNFMGAALGVTPGGMGAGMGGGMGGPIGPEPSSGIAPPPLTPVGGFNAASSAPMAQQPQMPRMPSPVNPLQAATPRSTARAEMKGPSGVDDILTQFEQARAQEAINARTMEPAGGMSTGPAVAAVVSGAVSIGSGDDMMSQAESVRTGGTASGRRRRRTAAPTGNTFSLDV